MSGTGAPPCVTAYEGRWNAGGVGVLLPLSPDVMTAAPAATTTATSAAMRSIARLCLAVAVGWVCCVDMGPPGLAPVTARL